MSESPDLFEFFRFVLATLLGMHTLMRLIQFIWHWRESGSEGPLGSARLLRYVMLLILRIRLRRFVYEFIVIGGLLGVLVLLVRLH